MWSSMSRTLLSLRPSGILKQAGSGSRSRGTTTSPDGQQVVAIVTVSGGKSSTVAYWNRFWFPDTDGLECGNTNPNLFSFVMKAKKRKKRWLISFYFVEMMPLPGGKQQKVAQKCRTITEIEFNFIISFLHLLLSGSFSHFSFFSPPVSKKKRKGKNKCFGSPVHSAPLEDKKKKAARAGQKAAAAAAVGWLTRRSPSPHRHCCLFQGVISQQDPRGPPTQRTWAGPARPPASNYGM